MHLITIPSYLYIKTGHSHKQRVLSQPFTLSFHIVLKRGFYFKVVDWYINDPTPDSLTCKLKMVLLIKKLLMAKTAYNLFEKTIENLPKNVLNKFFFNNKHVNV